MKKILIVVDMQKDFVDGALGSKEAVAIVDNVVNKIEGFDGDIIVTYDTHPQNYMETQEGKNLPVPHCIKGTDGWKLDAKVQAALDKKTYKAIEKPTFGSIELQNILYDINENHRVEEITLMGIDTSICVLSNAILCKATLPEVPVNVIAECCSSVTPESHKTALEVMKLCQINII